MRFGGMDPYALARFNNNTVRSPFPSQASLMSYVMTPAYSKQPGTPRIPPFCTVVSI